ncbi:unnamed protein product [Polarella glacialis]|uniref:RING-type E3 ubiquitin transferase n=1 Tax=Polarella glacialis TaxID=89957 RepID=A0A813I6A4_POLGL|nr:unnamed protein product [Polarella glacialis]CAE8645694.1 unnamed protein product [Polarella glacialis]
MFECNICLEQADEPVITRCGHLFCWSCLHQWLSTPRRSTVHGGLQPSTGSSFCPICKAGVSAQTVTPLYSRDGNSTDPRQKDPQVPPRPHGEWQEPEEAQEAEVFSYGGTAARYSFSAGYGHFPVVCALALSGSSGGAVPAVSRKQGLVFAALACAAVVSMILM